MSTIEIVIKWTNISTPSWFINTFIFFSSPFHFVCIVDLCCAGYWCMMSVLQQMRHRNCFLAWLTFFPICKNSLWSLCLCMQIDELWITISLCELCLHSSTWTCWILPLIMELHLYASSSCEPKFVYFYHHIIHSYYLEEDS